MADIQIVEAVGASANTGTLGRKSNLGKFIEMVVTQAIQEAYDDGIRDPDVIKQRMQAAREQALLFHRKKMDEMLKLPAAEQRDIEVPSQDELNSYSE